MTLITAFVMLIPAVFFAIFLPQKAAANSAQGWRFIVLRWFQSLGWLLLALSGFMRATENDILIVLSILVVVLAGMAFLVYLFTFMRRKPA